MLVNRLFGTQQEEQYLHAHMCICVHTHEHAHMNRQSGTDQDQTVHLRYLTIIVYANHCDYKCAINS
jgi:hypothetical protein